MAEVIDKIVGSEATKQLDDLVKQLERAGDAILKANKAAEGSGFEKQGASAAGAADALKKTNKAATEYEKVQNQLIATQDKLRSAQEGETKELIKSRSELQEKNKEIRNTIKAQDGEGKSITALTAKNAKLRAERNKINTATEEGRKKIRELNKEIDANDKVLKENASSLEKQRINVGNYGSALQGLPGPLGAVVGGVKGLTMAAKAFIATPLGLIIAAIAAAVGLLSSYFKSSEERLERLNKVIAPVSAAFTLIKEIIFELIDGTSSLTDGFKTLGKGIADVIVGTVLKQFAALNLAWQQILGLFKDNEDAILAAQEKFDEANTRQRDGLKGIANGFKELGEEGSQAYARIEAAQERARQIEERSNQLKRDKRELLKDEARAERDIAEFRLRSRQEDLFGAEERLAFINEARAIETDILQEKLRQAAEEVALQKLRMEDTQDLAEEKDKLAELEANLFRIQKTNAEKLRSLERDRQRLTREVTQQEIVLLEEQTAARIKADQSLSTDIKAPLAQRLDSIQNVIESEIELERKKFETRLRLGAITSDQEAAERQRLADRIEEIEEGSAQRIAAILQQEADSRIAIQKQAIDERNQAQQREILALQEQLSQGVISYEAYETKLTELKKAQSLQRLELEAESLKQQIAFAEEAGMDTVALQTNLNQILINLNDQKNAEIVEGDKAAAAEREKIQKAIAAASERAGMELYEFGRDLQAQAFQERMEEMDAEIEAIEEDTQRKLELAEGDAALQQQIREDDAAQKKKVDEKKRKEQKKQANIDKAFAIFEATVNTFRAVSNALASSPPPLNIILAGVMGALGAVQIARIAAQKTPAFAKGTLSAPGGAAIVGEKGTEGLIYPDGSKAVTPDRATMGYLPKGTQVIPAHKLAAHPEFNIAAGGMQSMSPMDDSRIVKAINKQKSNSVNITGKGIEKIVSKRNGRTRIISSYTNG